MSMCEEPKDKALRKLTLDYFLIDRVREILSQDVDNHIKASLMCDLVKDEVERYVSDAYDLGYEYGFENGSENDGALDALEEIRSIISAVL